MLSLGSKWSEGQGLSLPGPYCPGLSALMVGGFMLPWSSTCLAAPHWVVLGGSMFILNVEPSHSDITRLVELTADSGAAGATSLTAKVKMIFSFLIQAV